MIDHKTNLSNRMRGGTGLSALAALLAMSAPLTAIAQDAQSPKAADADEPSVADVVVTGTRLANGINAPTPVTVIGAETIQARAALKITDVLYELPSVLANPFPLGTSQAGGNFVVLRGFGTGAAAASRTLVLVDGSRFVPSNTQGQVDLNVVPTALVERVDIVTGGASAAYGSDAVAGVVNIVLKKKLDGVSGEIRSGISNEGDARTFGANLAWGTSFGDGRGQFLIAGEYSDAKGIRHSDRDFASRASSLSNVGTAANPLFQQVTGTRINATNGGTIVAANGAALAANNPLSLYFTSPTSTATFVPGTGIPAGTGATIGATDAVRGGSGSWPGNQLLLASPLQRMNLFARTSYDLSSNLTLWADGSFSRSVTDADLFANLIKGSGPENNFVLQRDINNYDAAGTLLGRIANPYIPASVYALMPANSAITVTRLAPELGNIHTRSVVNVYRAAAGLDGQIGDAWRWKVSGTFGQTNFRTALSNNIIEPNLAAAQDLAAINGAVTCRTNVPGQVPTARQADAEAGCVPANPVGPGSLASAANYLTDTLTNNDRIRQIAGSAEVQGSPFATWAGDVSMALGVDWRKDSLVQVTSPYSNRTNLAGGYGAGEFQQANPKSFAGSVNVKEIFGEVQVPLLRDSALGHSLDVNGAARYTDYSVSGGVTTWKVGATYSPVRQLLLRVVRSRDIRAANLVQLYGFSASAGTVALLSPANSRVNSPQLSVINQPNRSVSPEVANTLSFGGSLSNLGFLPGFSASVDFYKINLKGFIAQLSNQNLVDYCYGAALPNSTATAVNSGLCNTAVSGIVGGTQTSGRAVLDALAAGSISTATINNLFLNLGQIKTQGIDMEVGYQLRISDSVSFNSRWLATYVDKLVYNSTGLRAIDRVGDISGVPRWRWTLSETLNIDNVSFTATGRYVGPLNLDRSAVNPAASNTPGALSYPTIKSHFYLNLGTTVRIIDKPGQRADFFINVNNALNKKPPFTGTGVGTQASANSPVYPYTNINWYDVVGRAYTVGLRFKY